MAIQPDGRILEAWNYESNFVYFTGIRRLELDGSSDPSFAPVVEGDWVNQVRCLAVQPDGKVIVGGYFTNVNHQASSCLTRLNSDGTLDSAFNRNAGPTGYSTVYCLALAPDGKILVGGKFTRLAGEPRLNIGRLNADGTIDAGFKADAAGLIHSLALQANGDIIVGGNFTAIGGQARTCLARLHYNGTLDASFDPEVKGVVGESQWVGCATIQPDGKILVAGHFGGLAGQTRENLARLRNNVAAQNELFCTGSEVKWLRSGSCPEVSRTMFEISTNGTDWSLLGKGKRIPTGWFLDSISVPDNSIIRARGVVAEASYAGSSEWFIESRARVAPVILSERKDFGLTSGRFSFLVVGKSGWIVLIESSKDLQNWSPMVTNTLGTVPFEFVDPEAGNSSRRFYRIRLE